MSVKALADWLVYLLVRVFICIVQAMRIESCQSIARLLAFVACDVVRLRRAVIEENLRHAYPQWTAEQRHRLARQMWEHLFLMGCEIAHVPRKIHETNWRRYVTIPQRREIVRQLLDGRPTVLVSGHFGNFELAGYMAGLLGFSTFTIARPLDNPYLNRFVNGFREAKGQYILPKQGSAPQVELVLQAGGTLSLLGDQYAGPKGCWVDFLGRPASCHKALALFTLTSGAPLLVTYARRTGAPLQFEVGLVGAVDPAEPNPYSTGVKPLTQWYNQMLEQMIRRAPEQYWWVHRRWKGAPPPRTGRKGAPSSVGRICNPSRT